MRQLILVAAVAVVVLVVYSLSYTSGKTHDSRHSAEWQLLKLQEWAQLHPQPSESHALPAKNIIHASPLPAHETSPSTSPVPVVSPYIPGPCLPSNDEYKHRDVDFSKFTLNEIEQKREEWQNWMRTEGPLHIFSNASNVMQSRGLPAMKGRGIAIVIGDPNHINYLNTSIKLLRKYGCTLPIEVWSFNHELSLPHRSQILENSLPNAPVTLRFADDPLNYLPLDRGSGHGYHVKVSVIINSGFEEVLFLDVDTMPILNPDYLFDTPEYKATTALFWPDYWKTEIHSPVWTWFGQPCVDEFEQESGIMVINKSKAWNALMLLYYVNRNDEIRQWHAKFLHGDKDLFRFSFRAAGADVFFMQDLVSPGGFMVPEHENGKGELKFCGIAMMQFDPLGQLIFAHANFFKQTNKRKFNSTNPPLKVVKKYVKLGEKPGPKLGSKLAWYNARGSKAGFVGAGGYVCVDIFEGEERDGVVRKTEILNIHQRNAEFENDLYNFLVDDMVKVDKANYEAEEQTKKEKEKNKNGIVKFFEDMIT